MIPTASTIQRTGNFDGQKIEMSFDANSLVHIMQVLTDLYSNPIQAVIREYSTNARDSHLESGQTRPIEVFTPGPLFSFFKVKDYGVGLSVDDITNIYSKYGASTKRDTDAQTGMLGLGCKSALTYTDQFTIIGIKNGVKTSVVVSRSPAGAGTMEVVDTCSTNDPNGVEILVPAKRGDDFEEAAQKFFQYWEPGSVVLNGAPVKRFSGEEITPNIFVTPETTKDTIVMGGVPYPLTNRLVGIGYANLFNVVAFVEMGEVDFTPSREQLHYTTKTQATIKRIQKELLTNFQIKMSQRIDACENKYEAAELWFSLSHTYAALFSRFIAKYKDELIPTNITLNKDYYVYNSHAHRHQVRPGYNYLGLQYLSKHKYWFYNFKGTGLTSTQKKKLNAMFGGQSYMLFDEKYEDEWLDNIQWIDWEDVAKFKLPREPRTAAPKAVIPFAFDVIGIRGYKEKVLEADLDTSNLMYMTCQESRALSHRTCRPALTFLAKTATVVIVPQNKFKKFLINHPTARCVNHVVRDMVHKYGTGLSDDDKKVLNYEYSSSVESLSRTLDLTQIEDKNLVNYFQGIANRSSLVSTHQDYTALAHLFGLELSSAVDKQYVDTLKGYPMLRNLTWFYSSDKELCRDIIRYINNNYKENNAKV